jgi:arylsulfatase A-like enzyme
MLTRREFHQLALGTTAAAAVSFNDVGADSGYAQQDTEIVKENRNNMEKPNILLLMPDQWRGDCLSIEGHSSVMTPNIDEIAAKGVRFTHAYSTCASCIPARRSLLTGKYPSSNGMVGFVDGYRITDPTLPQLLKEDGYYTALVGRNMHQYPHDEPYGYMKQVLGSTYVGDDEYARCLENAVPGAGGIKGIGLSFNGWKTKPWPYSEHLHPTNWVVQKSRELLDEHDFDDPLFLTTSFYAPHPPFIPPSYYIARCLEGEMPDASIGEWEEKPQLSCYGAGYSSARTVFDDKALRNAMSGYFGLMNHLDDQLYWLIGEFKYKSEQNGKSWVIIFTSDHGEMLGDHYYFRKCEPFEGSARIPFLIQTSDDLGFESGQVSAAPVCLEDIMPTLLDLAGVKAPSDLDGKSLTALMRGQQQKVRDVLHCEHAPFYSEEQGYQSLTDGKYKYIWRTHSGREHLFDVSADRSEKKDLAPDPQMAGELKKWRSRLVEILKDRPEGFVSGGKLVAGREYPSTMPWLKKG